MKKRTRTIFEELSGLSQTRNIDLAIQTTANNLIESSINLIERIHKTYDAETALDLERRFVNSVKSGDSEKFRRGIQRVIENKQRGQ